jgi:tRNA/tmRNA/rRNA uracil-C5-methylase (TrmA/RlmC/RlmD family)
MLPRYSAGDGYRQGQNLLNGSDQVGMTQKDIRSLEVRGPYTITEMMKNRRKSDEDIMQEIKYTLEQNPNFLRETYLLPGDDFAQTMNQIAKQLVRPALSRKISEYEQFLVSEARENKLADLHEA